MAKFTVVVANTAQFEVEAADQEEATQTAMHSLDVGDPDVMAEIQDTSSGWEVTDVNED